MTKVTDASRIGNGLLSSLPLLLSFPFLIVALGWVFRMMHRAGRVVSRPGERMPQFVPKTTPRTFHTSNALRARVFGGKRIFFWAGGLLGEIATCEHIAQFYDTDIAFLDTLVGFVSEGLAAGESMVILSMSIESPVQNAASSPSATAGAQSMNYTIVAQDADEVLDVQNAPAVSMARFLTEHDQMALVPTISIYVERGNDRTQVRLLYMNAVALRIWKEMGMHPTQIGMRHRPTRTAVLAFGMPFSE